MTVYLSNATGNLNNQYQAELVAHGEQIGRVLVQTEPAAQRVLVRVGNVRHERRYGRGARISLDELYEFANECYQLAHA